MKIEFPVQAMHFHSLVRQDKAKEDAQKLKNFAEEIEYFYDTIVTNQNFKLDKVLQKAPKNKEKIYICIGTDRGFVGGINYGLSQFINQQKDDEKSRFIIVGKKVKAPKNKTLLNLKTSQFLENRQQIYNLLEDKIKNIQVSKIYLVYNHYFKVSEIELRDFEIFPRQLIKKKNKTNNFNFVVETAHEKSIEKLLLDISIMYITLQIHFAYISAIASENTKRFEVTDDALQKLAEKNEEIRRNKLKKQKIINMKNMINQIRRME